VKRFICIELLEEHSKATFYQMRFRDEQLSEFDKFWQKHDSVSLYNTDMSLLAYWMQKIGSEIGINDTYLRPEGGKLLKALPIDTSKLRVYCFRIFNVVLIFAGGGAKRTRTYQEDPQLHQQIQYVRAAGNKILRYLESGKIKLVNGKLIGTLCFEIEIKQV
jgi:hypothetical protein